MTSLETLTRLSALPAFYFFLLAIGAKEKRNRSVFQFFWMAGAAALVVHVGVAFFGFHEGSHAKALEYTRVQTLAMTGWNSGVGLFVNWLLLTLWVGDAAWLAFDRASYWNRPPWMHGVMIYFVAFMMFFAGVVFADQQWRLLNGGLFVVGFAMRWNLFGIKC